MKYIKSLVLLVILITFSNCSTTSNSDPVDVVVPPTMGTLTTYDVIDITLNSAISGGNITADGGSPITARGVVWDVHPNPTISLNSKTNDGTGTGSFDSTALDLESNTTYYLRAYATNLYGTAYGNQVTFTTPINPDDLPVVVTNEVTEITTNTAISGGIVTNIGATSVSSRGVVWSTSPTPTISSAGITINGANSGTFTSDVTNLLPSTTYYLRAYATNLQGTSYGEEFTFTTSPLLYSVGTGVTAFDGSHYNSVLINNKEWTSTNLNVTTYSDGTIIPQAQNATAWASLTTGAWCYYSFQTSNGITYGKLYNWYAIAGIWNDASKTDASLRKKIAPTGWHVSTTADWTALGEFLGGSSNAGGFIKEAGTTHWQTPNTGATNSTGMTALPGGNCSTTGAFSAIGASGNWWCSDEYNTVNGWCSGLVSNTKNLSSAPISKKTGYSVRLVKN